MNIKFNHFALEFNVHRQFDETPISEIQYSEWIPLRSVENRESISDIVENKRFQIRTDKKIDSTNHIRWTMGGVGWFTFEPNDKTHAKDCHEGKEVFSDTDPYFHEAGDITFLKTSDRLKIWFNDVLVVTWMYSSPCYMTRKLTGLKFKGGTNTRYDKVTTHYRFETG